jgi:hypothetical protein
MFLKWNQLKNEDHYTYYSWFEALCTMMSLTVLSPHLYKNEKVASHEIKSTWKYNLGSNIHVIHDLRHFVYIDFIYLGGSHDWEQLKRTNLLNSQNYYVSKIDSIEK